MGLVGLGLRLYGLGFRVHKFRGKEVSDNVLSSHARISFHISYWGHCARTVAYGEQACNVGF